MLTVCIPASKNWKTFFPYAHFFFEHYANPSISVMIRWASGTHFLFAWSPAPPQMEVPRLPQGSNRVTLLPPPFLDRPLPRVEGLGPEPVPSTPPQPHRRPRRWWHGIGPPVLTWPDGAPRFNRREIAALTRPPMLDPGLAGQRNLAILALLKRPCAAPAA